MIERYNKKYRSKEVMFNCEMIPAENVGVKHAKWDQAKTDYSRYRATATTAIFTASKMRR